MKMQLCLTVHNRCLLKSLGICPHETLSRWGGQGLGATAGTWRCSGGPCFLRGPAPGLALSLITYAWCGRSAPTEGCALALVSDGEPSLVLERCLPPEGLEEQKRCCSRAPDDALRGRGSGRAWTNTQTFRGPAGGGPGSPGGLPWVSGEAEPGMRSLPHLLQHPQ